MSDITPKPVSTPSTHHDENAARLYHTLELMAHPDARAAFEKLNPLAAAQLAAQREA